MARVGREASILLLELLQQLSRGLLSVTLRVVLRPAPQILAGLLEGAMGLPAELRVGAGWVSGQVENITGTARSDLIREVTANSRGEGADHLVDGAATSSSQVPSTDTGVVRTQVVQGLEVTIC